MYSRRNHSKTNFLEFLEHSTIWGFVGCFFQFNDLLKAHSKKILHIPLYYHINLVLPVVINFLSGMQTTHNKCSLSTLEGHESCEYNSAGIWIQVSKQIYDVWKCKLRTPSMNILEVLIYLNFKIKQFQNKPKRSL